MQKKITTHILLFCCFASICVQSVQAQTFTYTGPVALPDNSCSNGYSNSGESLSIPVAGIGILNGTTATIERVTINFTHPNVGDLRIWLQSPNGLVLELSTDNGGSGDNYTNAVFRDGAATNIVNGVAPFTGSYKPEGRNNTLSNAPPNTNLINTYTFGNTFNGITADGQWKILACDGVAINSGSVNSWSISFLKSTCLMPQGLVVGNITQNSASVSWNCTGCTGSFLMEYGPAGFTPGVGGTAGGGTLLSSAISPQNLAALTAGTLYDVYIRQNCSGTYSKNVLTSFYTLTNCASSSNIVVNPAPVPVQFANGNGSTGSDYSTDVAYDQQGNMYVTGTFTGIIDLDPGPGVYYLTTNLSYCCFVACYNSSGALQWGFNLVGGTSSNSIALSGDGALYITGSYWGEADFDPGSGTAILSGSTVLVDYFLAKYTTSGVYKWVVDAGADGEDVGFNLAIDTKGNVITSGYFSGTDIDFNASSGLDAVSSHGGFDIFVAKYTAEGRLMWVKNIGGSTDDLVYAIATDISDNIYITGYFQGTNVDFNPGPGTYLLSSSGGQDAYTAKFTPAGDFVWASSIAGTGTEFGAGIGPDAMGNVYVCGTFSSSPADFDPTAGVQNISTTGGRDYFLLKYNTTGGLVWVRTAGGTLDDVGSELAVSDQYIYFGGYYHSSGWDFNPGAGVLTFGNNGGRDVFMSRFDSKGILKLGFYFWRKWFGTNKRDRSKK